MSNQLRTIRLGGVLGSKFGRVHRLAVGSAAEAIHALGTLIAGFDHFLINAKDNGMAFGVFYGRKSLSAEQLSHPVGDDEIRLLPTLRGAKDGGWFQVIFGAVLIVAGAYFGQAWMVNLGWGMVVGGVTQLLTPLPKTTGPGDRPENTPSKNFNGPINTQAQGNPVQVCYGRMFTGSAVLSAGIIAKDQAYVPANGGGGGGGGATPWGMAWAVE